MLELVKMRDNQYLHVDVLGTGKKVVVLLHGIGGSSTMWIPFCLPHLKDYKFVIPNLRGFGKSGHLTFTTPNNTLSDYALDLAELIEYYSPDDKVIIAGLSMGSYATMEYFKLVGSENVEKFLSIDQGTKAMNSKTWKFGIGGENHDALFADFKDLMMRSEAELGKPFYGLPTLLQGDFLTNLSSFFTLAFHQSYEQKLIRKFVTSTNPILRLVATKITQALHWQSYYHCLRSYIERDYDFRKTMTELDIPVTLHIGKYSSMYPREGQEYVANNGKDVAVKYFEAGHALMYTSPIKFAVAFSQFLKS